jgi:hypothetical protein
MASFIFCFFEINLLGLIIERIEKITQSVPEIIKYTVNGRKSTPAR